MTGRAPAVPPDAALMQRGHAAFEAVDTDAVRACDAPAATLRDEVFALRDAAEIGALWRLPCNATRSGGGAGRLQASALDSGAHDGRAHREAARRVAPPAAACTTPAAQGLARYRAPRG
jgi:hypothetical protein